MENNTNTIQRQLPQFCEFKNFNLLWFTRDIYILNDTQVYFSLVRSSNWPQIEVTFLPLCMFEYGTPGKQRERESAIPFKL